LSAVNKSLETTRKISTRTL